MKKISKKNVIKINERTIEVHGENYIPPHNFLHESNLDYLIDIIDAEMFGELLYPNLSDKKTTLNHCNFTQVLNLRKVVIH